LSQPSAHMTNGRMTTPIPAVTASVGADFGLA